MRQNTGGTLHFSEGGADAPVGISPAILPTLFSEIILSGLSSPTPTATPTTSHTWVPQGAGQTGGGAFKASGAGRGRAHSLELAGGPSHPSQPTFCSPRSLNARDLLPSLLQTRAGGQETRMLVWNQGQPASPQQIPAPG